MSALAPTLQAFFTDRLIRQRHASGNTIAAYRDTWRLLLGYATTRTGQPPSRLDLADLDAPLIASFLDHLERERGNSVRTRNARLAAIHSLFRFAALEHPEHAQSIARVLAIPPKRFDRTLITYLTEPEIDALLGCCDQTTWTGRRDHALLLLAVQTGLRISELTGLTRADIHLGPGPHVACHGKGRKDRITPLTRNTVTVLRSSREMGDVGVGEVTPEPVVNRGLVRRPGRVAGVEQLVAGFGAGMGGGDIGIHGGGQAPGDGQKAVLVVFAVAYLDSRAAGSKSRSSRPSASDSRSPVP